MQPAPAVRESIRFGVFEVVPSTGEVRKAGVRIRVQDQPFRLLLMLLEHPGELVTRESLKEALAPAASFGDFDHMINAAIAKLRLALSDSADTPRYIETIPRRGYRFIFPVETPPETARSADLVPEPRVMPGEIRATISPVAVAPPTQNKALLTAAAAVLLVIAGLLAYKLSTRTYGFNFQTMKMIQVTESGNATLVTMSADGRYVVYVLRNGEKESLWVRQLATGSDVQILSPEVVSYYRVVMSPDGKYVYFTRSDKNRAAYLYMVPVLGGAPKQLLADVDTAPTWSPDGKKFAFLRGDPINMRILLCVANSDASAETVLAKLPFLLPFLLPPMSWSPDGKWIAVANTKLEGNASRSVIALISPVDGSMREFYRSPTSVRGIRWFPDGSGMLISQVDHISGKRQLYFLSYPDAKLTRFTNDLSSYLGISLDVTQDGRSVAAIQTITQAHLWVVPNGNVAAARPLTFGEEMRGRLIWSDSTHMLGTTAAGNLISVATDGHNTKLISGGSPVVTITRCGSTGRLLSTRLEDGLPIIHAADSDGGNLHRLGQGYVTACSPDGSWYLYADENATVVRMPLAGGAGKVLVEKTGAAFAFPPSLSADGKRVLYAYQELAEGVLGLFAGVVSSDGGPRLVSFRLPLGAGPLQWSPNGDAFHYALTRDGAGNIWEQPLSGGPPRQITYFPPGQNIAGFAWSPDGKQLALVRATTSSNVVLLRDFR